MKHLKWNMFQLAIQKHYRKRGVFETFEMEHVSALYSTLLFFKLIFHFFFFPPIVFIWSFNLARRAAALNKCSPDFSWIYELWAAFRRQSAAPWHLVTRLFVLLISWEIFWVSAYAKSIYRSGWDSWCCCNACRTIIMISCSLFKRR